MEHGGEGRVSMAGFSEGVDGRRPFGELFDLRASLDVTLDQLRISTRLYNLLHRWDVRQLGDLAQRTPRSFLDLRGAGSGTLDELLAVLADRAAAVTHGRSEMPSGGVTSHLGAGDGYVPAPWDASSSFCPVETTNTGPLARVLLDNLPLVAAWLASRVPARSLGEVLGGLGDGQPPRDVQDALRALEGLKLTELAGASLPEVDPMACMLAALDDLPERHRDILAARSRPSPPTLEMVGDTHGLTRERVRQIESKSRGRLLEGLQHRGPVATASADLAARLGPVTDQRALDRHVAAVLPRIEEVSGDERCVLVSLLLELAGPYKRWEKRWLATDAGRLELETLGERLQDPTGFDAVELIEQLRALSPGLDEPEALVDVYGLELFHGRVVRRGCAMQDRAHVVLEDAGAPLTFPGLLAAMPEGTHERSFRNALLADRRIVRVDRDDFALAAWGDEEYTGVADAIERELERWGGEARISDLADDLSERFEVSRSSVVAYARSVRFVQEDRGMVRLRRTGERVEEGDLTPLGSLRGCVVIEQRWAYRVTLDEKLLGGYSAVVPPSFAVHLGAAPLESVLLDTELGSPISVVRAALQPSIGRLRPIAERLGLGPGALLFVISPADEHGPVSFRSVHPAEVAAAQPRAQALLHLGLQSDATNADVACALDLPEEASADEIAARLRARREEDLVDALEDTSAGGDDVTGRDVADLLGL